MVTTTKKIKQLNYSQFLMKLKQILENTDNTVLNIPQGTTYSTNEVVVGEWLGKPLYSQVRPFTLDGTGNFVENIMNIDSTINTVIDVNAVLDQGGTFLFPEYTTYTSTGIEYFNAHIGFFSINRLVKISAGVQNFDGSTSVIYNGSSGHYQLIYTKSTD